MRHLLLTLCAALLVAPLLSGCNGGPEVRTEEVPLKADVQKEIDRVTASKDIPEAAKPGILSGLHQKLAGAK